MRGRSPPLQGNVRFGVAAMSYAGRFGVAVHVDAGALRAGVAGVALGDELSRITGCDPADGHHL